MVFHLKFKSRPYLASCHNMTNFFGRRNKREKTYIIGRGWQGRERKTLLVVFRVLNRGFYKGRKIQNIF